MAMLFPIQWDEPFPLVMVEAMACGTPVRRCQLDRFRRVTDVGKMSRPSIRP